jgi:hypothetical protein
MNRRSGMSMAAAVFLAPALAIAVLAIPPTWAAAESDGDDQPRPEVVMSFRATGQELVFRVPTGGCTTVGDFHVDVQRSGHDVSLSLARQRPDRCKGWFPAGIEISIPYGDVGLQAADRIRLVNNVGSQAAPPQ